MILREHEGGQLVDVIDFVGSGEIEALMAGVVRLIRYANGRFEQCVEVGVGGLPLWVEIERGDPWPAAPNEDLP